MARGLTALEVSWEAVYTDNSILKEREGHRYAEIDRSKLAAFQLVAPGEVLVRAPIHGDRTGHHLCYRRRTMMSYGTDGKGKTVWFIIGFVPMGPVIAFQPESESLVQETRFMNDHALFNPPTPHVDEGEHFTFDSLAHSADARLRPQQITLPSGYKLDVK